ncbi:hypothetical protein D9M68_520460 [compost metagenome]
MFLTSSNIFLFLPIAGNGMPSNITIRLAALVLYLALTTTSEESGNTRFWKLNMPELLDKVSAEMGLSVTINRSAPFLIGIPVRSLKVPDMLIPCSGK